MSAVVYRMYDANCRLLYVGCTLNLTQRTASHASGTRWFGEVDTISVEHFATRVEAETAEAAAIKAEEPAYNVKNASTRRRREHRDRRLDESTWPTTGLVMNRHFLDAWLTLTDHTIDTVKYVDPARLLELRLGAKTDLAEAEQICAELGINHVAALFPNRHPDFAFVDGRGFVATKTLAKEA